jgi:hypothetical protein
MALFNHLEEGGLTSTPSQKFLGYLGRYMPGCITLKTYGTGH